MTVLIDEIEAHLHPSWQRLILSALLDVVKSLSPNMSLQMIVVSHAPMVMAGIEPDFNSNTDRLFHLWLDRKNAIRTDQLTWAKQGDVRNWLISDAFGMEQAWSRPAERAIEAAEAWMGGRVDELEAPLNSYEAIEAELKRTVASHDPLWYRWLAFNKKLPGQAQA